MSERVVTIKLMANATGLVQGIGRARDAVGELQAKTVDSARSQREEWAKVGAGLSTVGVAMVGVGAAVMKTGIQYNMLQQTSRAALSTLLGSAEAANAQMNKLDDFARNSPFSKAVFIEAQQQLLGFGMEAKRVVPTLDAIQNAVAATGGSNQDIAELTRIIAQLEGGVKLSAETFNQFGARGIDAAQLIGSAMGKTSKQIRDEVTAGTLDADKAIQALTDGMTQRFSGAADNVKNTFEGSMDRVSAAWRDFASELATPLVDPNGGGALVDLLNWTADAMRAFQDLPGPIKTTISGLTGLVGVGALAGGTFLLALPKILEFRSALAGIGGVSGVAKKGASGLISFLTSRWVVGLVAAAAAMAVFNRAVEEGKTPQSEFGAALTQTTNLVDALQIATTNTKSNFWTDGFRESLKDLPGLMDRVRAANDDMMLVTGFSDAKALENVKQMGVELAAIAKTDFASVQTAFVDMAAGMDELQVEELLNQMPDLRAEFANAAADIGLAASEGNVLALAMGDIDYGAAKSAQSLEGIAGVAVDTTAAIAKLADEILKFGSAQIDADRAAIDLQDKIRSLSDAVADGAGSLDIYTAAGGKTSSALLDVAEGAKKQAEAMLIAGESQEAVNGLLESTREHLINQRIALGEDADAARAWADARIPSAADVAASLDGVKASAEAIPADVPVKVSAETGTATGQLSAFKQMLASIDRDVVVNFSARGGSQGDGYVGGGGGGGFSGGRALGGIIGYAGGGIIPGYDPVKRDTVLTPMRRGEGVLVPEVVRGLGASTIHALNAAGNSGGVSAVQAQFGAGLRASDFASAAPQTIVVQAPAASGGGANVTQNVYPQPGMSEAEVARIAADRVAWALKRR